MPKERRDRSVSIDKSRASPYRCSTSHPKRSLIKNPLESDENLKEWEDARCPVCMEHPHNAILLLCSSHDKGCRPYMCDTSYRHSNCFDQFRKSYSESQPPLVPPTEETPTEETPVIITESEPLLPNLIPESSLTSETEDKSKLVCPLCRGQVNGWVVVEAARIFMNTKSRSCASETCDFSGTYTDLRKHARLVHPLVRPSEADPERQRDWRRMERQRDLGDLLSTLQSSIGEDRNEDSTSSLSFDEGGWLTVFFLIRVFRPGNSSRSGSWSGTSRARAQVTVRRRLRTRLWGESYDGESRDDDNESSDGGSGSGPHNLFQLSRRRPTPDNDES
ncbi:uncharacterized protein LOC112500218 isoform X1 [Cynara cardunculus var. scolymus]|uniref:Zinc finger, RING/FYVE/PHD-type n=1 Tax=Cynara cardunculus var. scolymus TaxID=59895 RepID=A0A103Y2H6_CYNCS|nr:uncharacterized protein LOC112500218 isoform X1 [Cynara cardunculus var. scolymus]XP_024959361.1 uncharacterized protein LOC112500218 isoform X1 [Cynara cardunculus var. scolymus]XP_024959362.1 uncharacterized protein LOC112500218 isoform X1 [Cynara cardunculus var. scolymus]KVI01302.1 Protein of unknown function DUF1644 [Cynara cardunculus var. scolymus]